MLPFDLFLLLDVTLSSESGLRSTISL